MARLGLTCQAALEVFAQYETLQLKKKVDELQARLKKYEPETRIFETKKEYENLELETKEFLNTWVDLQVKSCTDFEYTSHGLNAIVESGAEELCNAVKMSVDKIMKNATFSADIAHDCMSNIVSALDAVRLIDPTDDWCNNEYTLRRIVNQAIENFLFYDVLERPGLIWVNDSPKDWVDHFCELYHT